MLVVFEGLKGSGKSTQAHILTTRLLVARINACQTKEPWLESTKEEISKTDNPLAHLLLYSADRCRHVEWMIEVLKDGWVVCDRYLHSTIAHQGPKLEKSFVQQCIKQSITVGRELLLPHLTIWLDLPVEQAISRVEARDERTITDEEWEQTRQAYKAYKGFYQLEKAFVPSWMPPKTHMVRIDCDGKSQDAIADEVWEKVKPLIEQ